MSGQSTTLENAFEALAIDDEGRACRDIDEAACRDEPRNFFLHVGALALTKSADGLIDPKLVLSWLVTAIGAPAALVGLLVPIREAGALLPQLFTAGALRRLPQRKWAWSVGAVLQGLSAAAIVLAALTLEGAAAGWSILAALTVLALARSICSVCYKDVLGKTVAKARRGTATGLASSAAAGGTILFALALSFELLDRMTLVLGAITLAGGFWVAASFLFLGLTEDKGATEGGANAFDAAIKNLSYLQSHAQLQRFIAVRALLTATALAPPFMIAAGAAGGEGGLSGLGPLVLASACASLLSSYVWGRLADRSSRKVLIISAAAGLTALLVTGVLGLLDGLAHPLVLPGLLFILMIAYQGVRLGRSTHLVDMADEETRAVFTALSNTIIGLLLLLGGGFSVLASLVGPDIVLLVMATMCGVAMLVGWGLDEVQAR